MLAVAVFSHGQQGHRIAIGLNSVERHTANDGIVTLKINPPDTRCVAAHRADIFFHKPNGHTGGCRQEYIACTRRWAHSDQLIALIEFNGDNACGTNVRVSHQISLLHPTECRREEQVMALGKLIDGENHGQLLIRFEGQYIDNRLAPSEPAALRQMKYFSTEDAPSVREE